MSQECDDPKCSCHQLAWMEEMERVEQEVFPDARPRGEVVVPPPLTPLPTYDEAIEKHKPLSDYEQGLADGLYRHAWMKDGTYYVGNGTFTLGQAIDGSITAHRETGRRLI